MAKIRETVPCPFCDKPINVFYEPAVESSTVSYVAGRKSIHKVKSKEKYEVTENCPHCGATRDKIEKTLCSGEDYKRPSREKVLERMRKAGLKTRI